MEPSPGPASSPRVYVPITRSNSPSPAYAVLHLVGYADPYASNHHPAPHAIGVARTSPSFTSATLLSGTAENTGVGNPNLFTGGTMDARNAGVAGSDDVRSATQDNISTESSTTGIPSPRGSSTGIVGVKKCSKVGSTGVAISVSHTEKETIVHTDSSNFREIVHQLTGASGKEDDLLPVTVPSRTRGSVDDAMGCLSKQDATSRGPDLGPRRPLPTKLFERRRSSKTLERITTSCRDLPPLVPSPVTPLASDFERICLPVTPVASPASGQSECCNVQMQPAPVLHQIGNVHLYSSHKQPGVYMHGNSTHALSVPDNMRSVLGGSQYGVHPSASSQQETSVEDSVIAEKGFFLHPQRPRTSEPALLPLFPESPSG